jgi:ABC-type Fe3+/spermidine/putrescine transport system ATPase subunit
MRNELRRIQRETGLTSVYVTHDQAEALAISDWIMVMRDGRIIERGTPEDIYRRPKAVFTARFIGDANLISGRVSSVERNGGNRGAASATVDTKAGRFTGVDTNGTLGIGDAAVVSIRPEDMVPAETAPGAANRLTATIVEAAFAGAAIEVELIAGETPFRWLAARGATSFPGRTVDLAFAADAAVILPEEKA